MKTLLIISALGTIASLIFGKSGLEFRNTSKAKRVKRILEIALYIAVGSIVWLPTLPIRFWKSIKKRLPKMTVTFQKQTIQG